MLIFLFLKNTLGELIEAKPGRSGDSNFSLIENSNSNLQSRSIVVNEKLPRVCPSPVRRGTVSFIQGSFSFLSNERQLFLSRREMLPSCWQKRKWKSNWDNKRAASRRLSAIGSIVRGNYVDSSNRDLSAAQYLARSSRHKGWKREKRRRWRKRRRRRRRAAR